MTTSLTRVANPHPKAGGLQTRQNVEVNEEVNEEVNVGVYVDVKGESCLPGSEQRSLQAWRASPPPQRAQQLANR